jgi:hypothetical protein
MWLWIIYLCLNACFCFVVCLFVRSFFDTVSLLHLSGWKAVSQSVYHCAAKCRYCYILSHLVF